MPYILRIVGNFAFDVLLYLILLADYYTELYERRAYINKCFIRFVNITNILLTSLPTIKAAIIDRQTDRCTLC